MKILSHVTPCSTRKVMAPTTAIAVRTPSTRGFHTSRSFFESVMEMRQPVHAPVPGRGIATNAQRPGLCHFRDLFFAEAEDPSERFAELFELCKVPYQFSAPNDDRRDHRNVSEEGKQHCGRVIETDHYAERQGKPQLGDRDHRKKKNRKAFYYIRRFAYGAAYTVEKSAHLVLLNTLVTVLIIPFATAHCQ